MNNALKMIRRSLYLCSLLCGLVVLASCGPSDPREDELYQAVQLMDSIIKSHVLTDAVRNADPQMHASSAASAATMGGITSNFPLPPKDIGILDTLEPEAWSVIIKADDEEKQVIIEGYGEDLKKPLYTKTVDFPPQ